MTKIRQAKAFILAAAKLRGAQSSLEVRQIDAMLSRVIKNDLQTGKFSEQIAVSRDDKKLLSGP